MHPERRANPGSPQEIWLADILAQETLGSEQPETLPPGPGGLEDLGWLESAWPGAMPDLASGPHESGADLLWGSYKRRLRPGSRAATRLPAQHQRDLEGERVPRLAR